MKRVLAATLVGLSLASAAPAHADDDIPQSVCNLIIKKFHSRATTIKLVSRAMEISREDAATIVDWSVESTCPEAYRVSWFD